MLRAKHIWDTFFYLLWPWLKWDKIYPQNKYLHSWSFLKNSKFWFCGVFFSSFYSSTFTLKYWWKALLRNTRGKSMTRWGSFKEHWWLSNVITLLVEICIIKDIICKHSSSRRKKMKLQHKDISWNIVEKGKCDKEQHKLRVTSKNSLKFCPFVKICLILRIQCHYYTEIYSWMFQQYCLKIKY